jgi:hypothetical protein
LIGINKRLNIISMNSESFIASMKLMIFRKTSQTCLTVAACFNFGIHKS